MLGQRIKDIQYSSIQRNKTPLTYLLPFYYHREFGELTSFVLTRYLFGIWVPFDGMQQMPDSRDAASDRRQDKRHRSRSDTRDLDPTNERWSPPPPPPPPPPPRCRQAVRQRSDSGAIAKLRNRPPLRYSGETAPTESQEQNNPNVNDCHTETARAFDRA